MKPSRIVKKIVRVKKTSIFSRTTWNVIMMKEYFLENESKSYYIEDVK